MLVIKSKFPLFQQERAMFRFANSALISWFAEYTHPMWVAHSRLVNMLDVKSGLDETVTLQSEPMSQQSRQRDLSSWHIPFNTPQPSNCSHVFLIYARASSELKTFQWSEVTDWFQEATHRNIAICKGKFFDRLRKKTKIDIGQIIFFDLKWINQL